jgi:hypothetical protein
MSQTQSIEQRLDNLEREMAELKQRVGEGDAKKNWIERITGSFANDPDFAEILRLGQEIRRADRPDDEVEG